MRHAEQLQRTGLGIAAVGLIAGLVASATTIRSQPPAPPAPEIPTARAAAGRCEIVTHGHYIKTSETNYFADSLSVTGRSGYTPSLEYVDTATIIPRRLNDGFGIRYRAYDVQHSVTWHVVYPESIRGFGTWTHHYNADPGDHEADVLYDFDYDYEMVAGRWRFEVDIDGKPGCSFTFVVE